MTDSSIQHTLAIFERTYNNLSPLVPQNISQNMKETLITMRGDENMTLEELEHTMIELCKQAWPYMRAFEDMYKVYEAELGDKLLQQKASHSVREKLQTFKELGGSFDDIYRGSVHEMFDFDERNELTQLLIDLKTDIRQHALQAIQSHDRILYDSKVEQYGNMIGEINNVIEDLHHFANEEEDDDFAQDIRGRARAIGQSLACLGPRMHMGEIRGSRSYYEGKKEERKLRRY